MENDKITLSPELLLNELMWNATRYCIGRHSYVSSYARDYWQIIRHNREKFSEDRLQFFARDIKNEIASSMQWWENIHTEGTGNDRIVYDPYFLMCRFLYEHPDINFGEFNFEIDCVSGEISYTKREKHLTDTELSWRNIPDSDLEEWSKLAIFIADSKEVNLKDGSRVNAIEFYEQVRYSADEPWRWEKHFIPNFAWSSYIPRENVKQVNMPGQPKTKSYGENAEKMDPGGSECSER